MTKKIGVLALQGAVTEHLQALTKLGVTASAVKLPADLDGLDGLIIPGGESTAIGRLIREQHFEEPLRQLYASGKAIFGTCAGLILCSTDSSLAPDELRLGFIDIAVERNGFGRQIDSFEALLPFEGIADPVEAVFIRAPYIRSVGKGVRVLASIDGKIVAAENDRVLITAFHPELTDDLSVLEYFLKKVGLVGFIGQFYPYRGRTCPIPLRNPTSSTLTGSKLSDSPKESDNRAHQSYKVVR